MHRKVACYCKSVQLSNMHVSELVSDTLTEHVGLLNGEEGVHLGHGLAICRALLAAWLALLGDAIAAARGGVWVRMGVGMVSMLTSTGTGVLIGPLLRLAGVSVGIRPTRPVFSRCSAAMERIATLSCLSVSSWWRAWFPM